MGMIVVVVGADTNDVFSPCSDSQVSRGDGFSFGLVFSTRESFFLNGVQLSPCDTRLPLAGTSAELATFRPKVDELSLLTINNSQFNPVKNGGFMVAFSGRKYAARSFPVMVADSTNTITSFTLVLEFQKGILQNLFWKSFGCGSCTGDSSVCVNQQDCGVQISKCRSNGGSADCNMSIQLAFSGTDKNHEALNSWYEVSNLRQFSLHDMFAGALSSLI
ncbi:uncharacterized protein LOC110813702 [Carica papaya]|uniref:uncharacterized protein LOC110813702 n=1 Tax=Carica papaya TaxID=3649 RepID=UPI000B8D0671|nr:uncharacterized protein LOC110813702 [Carica papaya]